MDWACLKDPVCVEVALMISIFCFGYFLITIEHITRISKTSIALLMAIVCWGLEFANRKIPEGSHLLSLSEHLANISQVVFFLVGALTIVEIINAHKGFHFVLGAIQIRSKRTLLWLVGILTFFLSSVLDNLTTTIIMVTLLKKLLPKGEERLLMGGIVVIAANAGGAWTPIGDVPTTMLWIGGQLSTIGVMQELFLPSFTCLVGALLAMTPLLKGNFALHEDASCDKQTEPMAKAIFWLGLGCMILVPIFKVVTGLPPFMGMIFGLGAMWLVTDLVHSKYDGRVHLQVPQVMSRVDMSSVLFFLGILLAVDALHTAGVLHHVASWMNTHLYTPEMVAVGIGLASAIVDNVPLVAATMGMYEIAQFAQDSAFWNLIAYCAGTGGSILVIGSAAGVAFMGLEKVHFFWYLGRVGVPAFIGYTVGIGCFLLFS